MSYRTNYMLILIILAPII